jgi:subtilisin family serine protease
MYGTHSLVKSAMLLAGIVCLASITMVGAQSPKTVVTDETQLPRFAYTMATPPSTFVTADSATFAPFLNAVRVDIDKTLATYDIQDKATLRDYLATRLAAELLTGDSAKARVTVHELRAAETKPALALLAGRVPLVYVAAAGTSGAPSSEAFMKVDRATVDALPWDVVQDVVKEQAGNEPLWTRDSVVGDVAHDLDPIAAKTGTLDGPSARTLVQTRLLLTLLAYYPDDAKILNAYIARHNIVKPDIWAARDVMLEPSQVKAPVLIGILDSGVDPRDYSALMYGGAAAQQHGLAFADDGSPSTSDLYPLPAYVAADYPHLVKLMTGRSDLESGIVSPEATATQQYLRSLSAAQAAALGREDDFIGEYVHGSHVAGIAVRGNPGARIVVARFDDNLANLAFAPSLEWVNRMAANFARIGAFFRDNNVRVVNMSWSDQVSEFEQWLAKTDPTSNPQARKEKAQELFAVWRSAVEAMIKNTPGTLFVAAAGNADSDTSFAQSVPASLVEPNLITVGAVNQAGDPTSFTSYGSTVAVYADGYHVLSKIPQGYSVRLSGTSMASPNVTNLAGKLFALDPSLTPEQVRELIVNGVSPIVGNNLKLIDPKHSVALLRSNAFGR